MLTRARRELRKFLKRTGWNDPEGFRAPSALHLLLRQALGIHRTLHIIQVGAYDGVHKDPLRPFIVEHAPHLKVVFFEPQPAPFAKLQRLYEGFSNMRCVNKAIGAPGVRTFYAANERFKSLYLQKLGAELPASTNSFERAHVLSRLKRLGDLNPDDYIESHQFETSELLTELAGTTAFHERTDLLQVDCEGMDDQVIYHSGIDTLKPRLINFESKNLSAKKLQALETFLTERGYSVTRWTNADTVAIHIGR